MYSGNCGSISASLDIKLSLNVLIALSVIFLMCIYVGTRCNLRFQLCITAWYYCDGSLSNSCTFTWYPLFLGLVVDALYVSTISPSVRFLKDCYRIVLESQCYITIMYWLPLRLRPEIYLLYQCTFYWSVWSTREFHRIDLVAGLCLLHVPWGLTFPCACLTVHRGFFLPCAPLFFHLLLINICWQCHNLDLSMLCNFPLWLPSALYILQGIPWQNVNTWLLHIHLVDSMHCFISVYTVQLWSYL